MRYLVLLLAVPFAVKAQYKYGIKPVTFSGYLRQVAENPDKELVNLGQFIPGVVLDIRYATTRNFTGEKIYNLPRAYARRPVAEALKRAQQEFALHGAGIKIYDAYRPYSATVKFYEIYRDTTYVASPYKGSRHNRGCAVDITLIDLTTGSELKMPTAYDTFTKQAWAYAPVTDPEAGRNRKLLIEVMHRHGFRVNASEWWHFDFAGWQNFEVLDIPFEELEEK
ncbi:MAG: hypothetical protein KatS3mg032_1080 [Cyclobacteriaceae bacterium]|nr:MAG: hypothetical protein KatS3mg032_1080 [Cyclobacteriaceae bacterium]